MWRISSYPAGQEVYQEMRVCNYSAGFVLRHITESLRLFLWELRDQM